MAERYTGHARHKPFTSKGETTSGSERQSRTLSVIHNGRSVARARSVGLTLCSNQASRIPSVSPTLTVTL